jgi:hypothetical protein
VQPRKLEPGLSAIYGTPKRRSISATTSLPHSMPVDAPGAGVSNRASAVLATPGMSGLSYFRTDTISPGARIGGWPPREPVTTCLVWRHEQTPQPRTRVRAFGPRPIGCLCGDNSGVSCPAGFTQLGQDLNQGSGGNYVYTCLRYSDDASQAIEELYVNYSFPPYGQAQTSRATCDGYDQVVDGDLNDGLRVMRRRWRWRLRLPRGRRDHRSVLSKPTRPGLSPVVPALGVPRRH